MDYSLVLIGAGKSARRHATRAARAAWTVALGLATLATPAFAQPVTTNSALEELRKRTPAGGVDEQIIDDWLAGAFDRIGAGSGAAQDVRGEVSRITQAPDSSRPFRTAVAERLSALAQKRLPDQATPLNQSLAITRTLMDLSEAATIDGLAAALNSPADSVRYLGAKGLEMTQSLATQDPVEWTKILGALKQAGQQETSGVVAEKIYGAILSESMTPEAVDALVSTLAARLERYRKGQPLTSNAEVALLEYLLAHRGAASAGQAAMVRQLAVLLRLDVERYAAGEFVGDEKEVVETRIFLCEQLLEQIVQPSAGQRGDVRGKMQEGGVGVGPAMQLELLKWIGSSSTPAVLNQSPWSVPAGAP